VRPTTEFKYTYDDTWDKKRKSMLVKPVKAVKRKQEPASLDLIIATIPQETISQEEDY